MSILRIKNGVNCIHVPISEIVEIIELGDGGGAEVRTRGNITYRIKDKDGAVKRLLRQLGPSIPEQEPKDDSLFGRIFGDFFKFPK